LGISIPAQKILQAQSFEERLEQALALEQEAAQAAESNPEIAIDRCRRAALRLHELGVGEQDQAVCWLLVGGLELGRKNFQEAHGALQSSLQILERFKSPPANLIGLARLQVAESLLGLGERDRSFQHLDAASDDFRRDPERKRAASGLKRVGMLEVKLGRLSRARGLFEEALVLVRRAGGTPQEIGACVHNLAEVYQLQGQFDEALSLIQEALLLGPSPESYKTLGSIYLAKAEYAKAIEAFEQAEDLYQRGGRLEGLWIARTSKAAVYHAQGRIVEALSLYQEAVKVFRSLKNDEQLPVALSGAGAIYHLQGRNTEARQAHQEALELRRRLGNKNGESVALNNLAAVDLSLGSWDEALARLEESLALRREVGDRQGEALVLLNSGFLQAEFARFEEAVARFEKTLEISREIKDPVLEAQSLQYLGQALGLLGRSGEALTRVKEALGQAREIGNRFAELAALKMKGVLLVGRGERRQALDVLSRARALSHEIGDRAAEAEILTVEGIVLLKLGYEEDSASPLRKALEIEKEMTDLHFREATLLALGIINQNTGHRQEAIQDYREAIQADEALIGQTRTDELLQGFMGGAHLAYHQLIRLLALENDAAGAFAVAEQSRSRAFLRQVGSRRIDVRKGVDRGLADEEDRLRGRLRDLERQVGDERRKPFDQQNRSTIEYLGNEMDQARRLYGNLLIRLKQTNPEYASLVHASPLDLAEVQKLLGPDTTLIEYFNLDDQLLAWVIEADSYRLLRLPVPAEALAERIALFRGRIASREAEDGVSVNLYKYLFAALEPSIHHENLLIVPHGALHSLPFAALLDGKGRPLVERFSLTLLPSASVLPFLRTKRSPNEGRLLALGDPDGSLSHARDEVRAVAALYGTEPLLGVKATESSVRARSREIDILHLAAHSTFDAARPLFSRIEISPGGGDDGHLEVHEVFEFDLTGTNLVVLSGCGTALGNRTEGDDLTGFSRAFLYAGTPSVLATLWPVDDEASSALMTSFYRHLRQGRSPSGALQAAQLETARQERWQAPYYWAGFVLIGDMGVDNGS
jgi:CHAT domain-containing protein/Tfp pilus assembly protein PilF